MATQPISSQHPEVQAALKAFRINDCGALNSTGIDAVHEILPMIHALSTLMEVGFRKDMNDVSLFDEYNPELVSSAFAGIGYLASLAKFHAGEQ